MPPFNHSNKARLCSRCGYLYEQCRCRTYIDREGKQVLGFWRTAFYSVTRWGSKPRLERERELAEQRDHASNEDDDDLAEGPLQQ